MEKAEGVGGEVDGLAHPDHLAALGVTQLEFTRRNEARVRECAALQLTVDDPGVPPSAKHEAVARYKVNYGPSLFSCPGCWLRARHCICERVEKLPCRSKVVIWMHHKEYGLESNTGKVLTQSLQGCELYVKGLLEEEAALLELLRDPNRPAVVLWPGDDTISAADAVALLPESGG
eukprot:CAMPEP_0182909974 /NCGR_PEP_ID=MMETSP0034_2-20130328/36048_1 /TAXON_ID=156128 /ORGANISM="Nephroselmis pyriformis, Strain CCMP717" /LENGTH=175 /DNA_ID=CAMNT_0025046265 /DNA_START=15 /DNA_END=539 /DNA_ORIENTATION=-